VKAAMLNEQLARVETVQAVRAPVYETSTMEALVLSDLGSRERLVWAVTASVLLVSWTCG